MLAAAHPITRACRPPCLDSGRGAGDQAAAPDRNDDRVELVELGGQLDADGCLAAHHFVVVVGRHVRAPGCFRHGTCMTLRLDWISRNSLDRRAPSLHVRQLGGGCYFGHEYGRRDTEMVRAVGDGRAVVARRCRDHASLVLGVGERHQSTEGAPDLERPG